jgi:hypothetical protein
VELYGSSPDQISVHPAYVAGSNVLACCFAVARRNAWSPGAVSTGTVGATLVWVKTGVEVATWFSATPGHPPISVHVPKLPAWVSWA